MLKWTSTRQRPHSHFTLAGRIIAAVPSSARAEPTVPSKGNESHETVSYRGTSGYRSKKKCHRRRFGGAFFFLYFSSSFLELIRFKNGFLISAKFIFFTQFSSLLNWNLLETTLWFHLRLNSSASLSYSSRVQQRVSLLFSVVLKIFLVCVSWIQSTESNFCFRNINGWR